jgi:hypothetical protein
VIGFFQIFIAFFFFFAVLEFELRDSCLLVVPPLEPHSQPFSFFLTFFFLALLNFRVGSPVLLFFFVGQA